MSALLPTSDRAPAARRFGLELKRAVKARGTSQRRLAADLGLNRGRVANWAAGTASPTVEMAEQMADALMWPRLTDLARAGSVRVGVRVDIRPEMEPTIVADCRAVPLPDESFDWIMADPPYSEDYASNLYGTATDYPKPGQIIREASRLLRPGGRVGLLHFQVPMHRPPLRMVGVWGVSTGAGYAIRAWTVFEKAQRGLWEGSAAPSSSLSPWGGMDRE